MFGLPLLRLAIVITLALVLRRSIEMRSIIKFGLKYAVFIWAISIDHYVNIILLAFNRHSVKL